MAELISDSDKPPLKDISSRLDKIVTQRVGWVFLVYVLKVLSFRVKYLAKVLEEMSEVQNHQQKNGTDIGIILEIIKRNENYYIMHQNFQ